MLKDQVEIPALPAMALVVRLHFAPDDEGASEHENYRSPDHTH
jgi:hypothetical protein